MSKTFWSFDITIIESIAFEIEIVCSTSLNINLQSCSFFSFGKSNLDFALEKVFTGIIADIFKLDAYLF